MNTEQYIYNGLQTVANLASGNIPQAIGSGINATMGLFGIGGSSSAREAAALQYNYNLKLQKQAQEWNEYMYKNRYTMQVDDLKNAGINPLFGMGQAPTVTSGTNSAGIADTVGEQNNKFNQMMSLLDFGQNLSAKRAQTKLTEQLVQTEEQNTLLRTAEAIGKQLENEWLPREKEAKLKNTLADTIDKLASANERRANTELSKINKKASAREVKLQTEWDKNHPLAKHWATAFRRFGIGGNIGVSMPIMRR